MIRALVAIALLAAVARAEEFRLLIFPESCWAQMTQFRFPGECLAPVIARFISVGNLAVVVVYRVPQILKLLETKSAVGLSVNSLLFDLTSLLCVIAYYFTQGYDFMNYGENYMNLFQLWVVFALVRRYGGMSRRAFVLGTLYAVGFLGVVFSGLVPGALVKPLLSVSVLFFVFAKTTQTAEILRTRYSGNLSLITLAISPMGLLSRLVSGLINLRHDTFLLASLTLQVSLASLTFLTAWWYKKDMKGKAKVK